MPFGVGILIALLAMLAVAGYYIVRPRILHWGATSLEASRVMDGDELISNAIYVPPAPSTSMSVLKRCGLGLLR